MPGREEVSMTAPHALRHDAALVRRELLAGAAAALLLAGAGAAQA
jgi:hypothetical protein